MRRAARLQSARHWLAGYSGKNPIRSYAKWFGVDWMCAVRELEILGVKLDPVYVQQLRTTLDERPKHRKAAKAAKAASEAGVDLDGCGEEWDHEFQFIAGRTSGGAPYGVQWDALPDQQD